MFSTSLHPGVVPQPKGVTMSSDKQESAARCNLKKAAAAAARKKTVRHLSAKTRSALGHQGAKVAQRKFSSACALCIVGPSSTSAH